MNRRIVIAGGNGFLGQELCRSFIAAGDEVTVLTRRVAQDGVCRQVRWDGRSLEAWSAELEGAGAVINLAGRSVDCRYTDRNRRLILESRIESTRVLGEAIAACRQPPPVWLNASTATIYRHSFDRPMDETTGEIGATPEARDAFSIEVATAWEAALDRAPTGTATVRKVALRAAMVLGRRGGVFPVLRRLVRLGLGGRMGSGRQYMSWIHAGDFYRAVAWILDQPGIQGPINLAAPEPLPNADFMKALRLHCGMPFGLPAARWMLEAGALVLRTETELMLKSRRVVPGRLLAEGFQFQFPSLDSALDDLVRR